MIDRDIEPSHRPQQVVKPQQLARKAQIAHMLERGWSTTQIAEELGISTSTVEQHIKALEHIWLQQILKDVTLIKARKLAEYSAVKRAAWHAFDGDEGITGAPVEDVETEGSFEGATFDDTTYQIMNEAFVDGPKVSDLLADGGPDLEEFREAGSKRVERLRSLQGQTIGDRSSTRKPGRPRVRKEAAFLKIVLDAIAGEKDLLGLDAPKKSLNLNINPENIKHLTDDQLDALIKKTGLTEFINDLSMTDPAEELSSSVAQIRDYTYGTNSNDEE